MVANIHYRWDFIGLSTDTKPTPATSEKVVDGSTYYCSDTSKLYVFYKDTWYERKALGGGGGGGGSYTAGTGIDITNDTISVDTDTIQEKLTAGTNVTISDNTISATDTTYSNFTGTDGTAAGTAGLVPAPATTDAGKFLKADGTWDTVSGGGSTIKTLTSADINYPENNPAGIALWKLEPGIYRKGESGLSLWFCSGSSQSAANQSVAGSEWGFYQDLIIITPSIYNGNPETNYREIIAFSSAFPGTIGNYPAIQWTVDKRNGNYQGVTTKFVKETEFIPLTGTAAPTNSTVANFLGEVYIDTSNQDAYICVSRSGGYTWKKITP